MEKEELERLRKIVELALIRIGIRCDLKGFKYLCSAVEHIVKCPDLIHRLCKGLYVEVGKSCKVKSVYGVERDIRNAIENTMVNKSFCELNRMFKAQLYTIDEKPTPGELIRLLADYYTLGLYEEN